MFEESRMVTAYSFFYRITYIYTLCVCTAKKIIVKLRQGSGKERQGKARKGKDGER